MAHIMFSLFLAFVLLAGALSTTDVRLVDAAGDVSSVGLLQINTDAGFGTVCGANAAAADAALLRWHIFVACLACPAIYSPACCQAFSPLNKFCPWLQNHSMGSCIMLSSHHWHATWQGHLSLDGLCTWFCQQLSMWVLRRGRFVWRRRLSRGMLSIVSPSVACCALSLCPLLRRQLQI
jgi:hypothetical protein